MPGAIRSDIATGLKVVDPARCIGCGNCVRSCPYQAIRLQEKVAVIDSVECFGCGLCISRCPVQAIGFPKA